MEFCNTIVDSLIPMPQFFEATSGREYLIKDGCRAVISVAEPIGVKEKAEELFWNYWQVKPAVALQNPKETLQSLGGESYHIGVTQDELYIAAYNIKGMMNAFKTLRQLAEVSHGIGELTGYFLIPCQIKDYPALSFRGVHICIFPETPIWDIEKQLRIAAYHKFNYAIIETWGVFPFESHPEFCWDDRKVSKTDLQRLIHLGKDIGITLIPQLNLFGHASASRVCSGKHAILDYHPSLQPLFEPLGWSWCISNPEVRRIQADLVLELYEFYGRPEFFHIGCDEAYDIGSCCECRKHVLKDLLKEHILFFYELLKKRGCRIIMWHDMLVREDDVRWKGYIALGMAQHYLENLHRELPRDIVIADWQYLYPESKDLAEPDWPTSEFFKNAGFDVLVCPWLDVRGTKSLGAFAADNRLMGMLATTWHMVHDHKFADVYGIAAAMAWNPESVLSCPQLATAMHLRQIGWDMNIADYAKTGFIQDQIDPGKHPHLRI